MTEPAAAHGRQAAGGADGIVLLDKPVGLSSNVALQKVRRIFAARKAGHTGSLDPLASGLLPICLGQATRFSGYLLDAAKGYRVTGRLGARTATGDVEGEVVENCPWEHLGRTDLETSLAEFRGQISQVPPMYSALKQGGERLYRKARRGELVERAARDIDIYRLELTAWNPPDFALDALCSKGTYVRTLVEDVARAVGSCAHVTALRRYRAGPFEEQGMHSLESLQQLADTGPAALAAVLLPPDAALGDLPAVELGEQDTARLQQGQPVMVTPGGQEGTVRVYGPGGFFGVGQREAGGTLRARRLLEVESG